jgi:hypothetical protein
LFLPRISYNHTGEIQSDSEYKPTLLSQFP